MTPTIGRIVNYKLSAEDAEQINRRRTHAKAIADRIKEDKWPIGAQAHIGNAVTAGQEFPMIIVAVWSETCVNGQVFLDGTDNYWALSRLSGDEEQQWKFPTRI